MNNDTRKAIAARLRAERAIQQITQADVAVEAGISRAYLGQIEEDGDAKISTLEVIAAALGLRLVVTFEPSPESDIERARR